MKRNHEFYEDTRPAFKALLCGMALLVAAVWGFIGIYMHFDF